MGKDWSYWSGGGRSTKRGRAGDRDPPSGCINAVLQLFDFHLFHFAVHEQQPSFHPDSFLPEEPTILKGVEAPRNSLELQEPVIGAAAAATTIVTSLSSNIKAEENLNIPMGIQVRTRVQRSTRSSSKERTDDLCSEYASSPGTKTPNLVARLMGLDLLPPDHSCFPSSPSAVTHLTPNTRPTRLHSYRRRDQNLKPELGSPKRHQYPSSSSNKGRWDIDIMGTRSLPVTPRISSARRSDVEHRLSLQINRENNISGREEFEFTASSSSSASSALARTRRKEIREEDESPSRYTRQIVKQVRESVGRKVGLDITNTLKNREQSSEEHGSAVLMEIRKKVSKAALARHSSDESSSSKQSTPPCSPRLRFLEPRNKTALTEMGNTENQNSSPSTSTKASWKPKSQPLPEQKFQKCARHQPKKPQPQAANTIRNKKEETFVRSLTANRASLSEKKCRKTPLSNELTNISVPTLFPVKKDPPNPATKLPQKQKQSSDGLSSKRSTQLSSSAGLGLCSKHSYKQEATQPLGAQGSSSHDRSNGVTTTGGGADRQYVSRILKRTGIESNVPVSFARWYSPSHPLDPSVFHHLEPLFPITAATAHPEINQRCNRKLMFQLVDEILADLLRHHIDSKPWVRGSTGEDWNRVKGWQLMEKVWARIGSFPSADCRVLEDIDALIDMGSCRSQISDAVEEESEGIVSEIERDVTDWLLQETVLAAFRGVGFSVQERNVRARVWERAE